MPLQIVGWSQHYENNRTREMKTMAWVPVPNRMDGDGYTRLVDHPNGAAHLGAWLAILEICSRQKVRGTFPQEGAEIPQALARISRLPAEIFEEVLPRLEKLHWIHIDRTFPQEGAEIPQEGASRDARAGASVPFPSVPFPSVPDPARASPVNAHGLDLAKFTALDEEFARMIGAFLAAGVRLSEPQVAQAAQEWVSLPESSRVQVAASAEARAKSHEARFMGLPATWLRKREWEAVGPGRLLRAPPSKSEMATEEAAKKFSQNRGKERSF